MMKSVAFTEAPASLPAGGSGGATSGGFEFKPNDRAEAATESGADLPGASGFRQVSLAELRAMRNGLKKEEGSVSYWRRILQARMDLMHRQADNRRVSVPQLAEVLADAQGSHRRVAALSVDVTDDLAPLPNLVELWTRSVPEEGPERDSLITALHEAEHTLSQYRLELHRRIDLATEELIRRYRDNPDLALTALRESLPLAVPD